MILKLSLISIILLSSLFSLDVFVAKKSFGFEEKLELSHLELINLDKLNKNCIPISLKDLEKGEYLTRHYINKGSVLCKKDFKLLENNEVVFNFGGLKILKKGKIVYENKDFIRFKNLDGSIEKIYKDGRQ